MLNIMMDEFISTYRVKGAEPVRKEILDSASLAIDEVKELEEEAFKKEINVPDVAKEMADIIYVTAQRMRRMGFDVDVIMKEVHRSNLSKTVPTASAHEHLVVARKRYPEAYIQEGQNYAVLRCAATNKVIKPETYSPAVITGDMI